MRPRAFREMTRHRQEGRMGGRVEWGEGEDKKKKQREREKDRAELVERNGWTRALECFERPRAVLLARAARWLRSEERKSKRGREAVGDGLASINYHIVVRPTGAGCSTVVIYGRPAAP